jgi:hypothetical protein
MSSKLFIVYIWPGENQSEDFIVKLKSQPNLFNACQFENVMELPERPEWMDVVPIVAVISDHSIYKGKDAYVFLNNQLMMMRTNRTDMTTHPQMRQNDWGSHTVPNVMKAPSEATMPAPDIGPQAQEAALARKQAQPVAKDGSSQELDPVSGELGFGGTSSMSGSCTSMSSAFGFSLHTNQSIHGLGGNKFETSLGSLEEQHNMMQQQNSEIAYQDEPETKDESVSSRERQRQASAGRMQSQVDAYMAARGSTDSQRQAMKQR